MSMNRNFIILLFAAFLILACAPAQIMKTSLKITVLDELGNAVEGASVTLYSNEKDYRASENPVKPVVHTNNKGIATVKELEAKKYFLDVQKGDKNNVDAGVQTGTLEANKINKLNVIIE